MHYLDNAATTKPPETVCQAVLRAMTENFGNPSSLHGLGVGAEKILDESRAVVGAQLGFSPEETYFTSCATESSNAIILGAAENYGKRKKTVVTTAVEHPATARPVEKLEKNGFKVVRVNPDKDGKFTAESIASAVDEDTFLVSCMLVNNETGYILPAAEAFRRIKKRFPDCITHCDAVQGFLKTDTRDLSKTADCVSVSGHKVGAPKGIGAACIKKGVRIAPLLLGGGQERGFRSGTESVPLIAGFGAAVKLWAENAELYRKNAFALRERLRERLAAMPEVVINSGDDCSPFINSISAAGLKAEVLLHFLEARGVYVSSGSACSKGKKSSVLKAFGLPEKLLDSTIRASFSADTALSDIDALADGLQAALSQLCRVR